VTSNDETDAATPQRIDLAEFEDLQHSWRTRSGIYDELFSHWISERKEEIMAELKRCYDLIDELIDSAPYVEHCEECGATDGGDAQGCHYCGITHYRSKPRGFLHRDSPKW